MAGQRRGNNSGRRSPELQRAAVAGGGTTQCRGYGETREEGGAHRAAKEAAGSEVEAAVRHGKKRKRAAGLGVDEGGVAADRLGVGKMLVAAAGGEDD